MKEKIINALQKRLNESYPIKELNGGYRDGLRDAMIIISKIENIQEDSNFPPMTDNPLHHLFADKYGNRLYREVGRLCTATEWEIKIGNKIFVRNQ